MLPKVTVITLHILQIIFCDLSISFPCTVSSSAYGTQPSSHSSSTTTHLFSDSADFLTDTSAGSKAGYPNSSQTSQPGYTHGPSAASSPSPSAPQGRGVQQQQQQVSGQQPDSSYFPPQQQQQKSGYPPQTQTYPSGSVPSPSPGPSAPPTSVPGTGPYQQQPAAYNQPPTGYQQQQPPPPPHQPQQQQQAQQQPGGYNGYGFQTTLPANANVPGQSFPKQGTAYAQPAQGYAAYNNY